MFNKTRGETSVTSAGTDKYLISALAFASLDIGPGDMADAADDDLAPVVRPKEQQGGLPTILTHLLTLQARARRELYSHPSNALSIFRLLPPLARHLILVLLFLPNGPNGLPQLASDDVAALLTRGADAAAVKDEGAGTSSKRSKSQRALDEAKELLSDLGIIVEAKQVVSLNGIWTDSLKRALIGGWVSALSPHLFLSLLLLTFRLCRGDHRSFGVPSQPGESQRIPISRLDQYALRSWESILLYMVASIDAHTPSKEVLLLLRQAGLMQPEAPRSENLYTMGITSDGFQFLLNDVPTQLWTLLETYLRFLSSERNSTNDVVEHLTFLFTLSSATLGQDYEISALAPSQRGMLEFFRDMGLVYMKNERSRSFYPTRLITTLTSFGATPLIGGGGGGSGGGKDGTQDEAGVGGGAEEERGFVILETNYKVYAYTSNKLRIDVLNLFVHIKSRFPNLVTGVITRDSVKEALSNGIGAEQVGLD